MRVSRVGSVRSHPFLRALVAGLLLLLPAATAFAAAVQRPAGCCATAGKACCCRPGKRAGSCRIEAPCGTREGTTARSAVPAPALPRADNRMAPLAAVPFTPRLKMPVPTPGTPRPPDPPPEATA